MTASELQGKWVLPLDGGALPSRELIGGKAWSIARMFSLSLPVPPAFVITTRACKEYLDNGALPASLDEELLLGIEWLEARSGRRFAQAEKPLLLSVRSGAAVSMPGMMDTVLNLGITEATMQALAVESGSKAFARDTYRRFYELYTQVVLRVTCPALKPETELLHWRQEIEATAGAGLPAEPIDQLREAVKAVFDSWTSRRAKRYRQHHDISDDLGTAVTIQAMVFGNLDDNSGTGVLFSRNPLTGEREPYGEYLSRAQGEDVVSGKHTPGSLDDMYASVPDAHKSLLAAARQLEEVNGDVQDIEFTVQQGRLYLLQSRTAKRSPAAAVRIAVDMQREGVIDVAQAIGRITPQQVRAILSPRLRDDVRSTINAIAMGQGVSPGIGIGVVVNSADEAEQRVAQGETVVLATATTSPEDVHGMLVASAVITEQGGSTSHAAVVSRALGVPCIVGCGTGTVTGLAGEVVTVDGGLGKVYAGVLDVIVPDEREDDRLGELLGWVKDRSPLQVLRADEVPDTKIIDLDSMPEAAEIVNLLPLIAGFEGARGGAIASEEGVAAAVKAGLRFIVADPTLPPLLAAVQFAMTNASDLSKNTGG